jgi:hypothetical protein
MQLLFLHLFHGCLIFCGMVMPSENNATTKPLARRFSCSHSIRTPRLGGYLLEHDDRAFQAVPTLQPIVWVGG